MLFVVLAAIVAAFVLGALYGRRLEAKAVASALRARTYVAGETGKAFTFVRDYIVVREQSLLARVKKFL